VTARRAVLALLLLAGCEQTQPFRGNPGANARRLAAPPAYRLAVPAPTAAGLSGTRAASYADALAEALAAAEIPAVAGEPWPLDWRLIVRAEPDGALTALRYELRDADGRVLGERGGARIPAARWVVAEEAMLASVARADAPQIALLVARADAAARALDPESVIAPTGPARVRIVPVRGAPGDGNAALTARIADFLAQAGYVPQDIAGGAGFAVQGVVAMAPGQGGLQRVEIVWTVTRADGFELGRVVQLNEVPAGALNGLWGDVAYVVAQEASGGVRDVLVNAGAPGAPRAAGR
jgi:hypothetical protein